MKKHKQIQTDETPDYITAKEFCELPPDEQKNWQGVPARYERVPLFSKIAFVIAGICLIFYVIAIISPDFADFFNFYIGGAFRFIAAKLTNIFPFSLAEFFLISVIPLAVCYIIFAMRHRSQTWKMVISSLSVPVALVALIFSSFVLTLGTGYRTPTLEEKLDFEQTEITKENLYQTAEHLISNINALSHEIDFDEDGFSVMPYSFGEMNKKLLDAYEKYCEKNDHIYTFDSNLKPVLLSEGMSYLHTLGIYTFFTGESNINISFPDYTTPYTAAHELAHQRGIAREDEANMIAFLVCMESDDAYIRYCAYVNMYEYVANALYRTDADLYFRARGKLNMQTRTEQAAYSEFFEKYQDSGASKVSSAVNDTYLKVQGTEGEISYDLVVELTVAYYKTQGIVE